jgi:hypothetical protein
MADKKFDWASALAVTFMVPTILVGFVIFGALVLWEWTMLGLWVWNQHLVHFWNVSVVSEKTMMMGVILLGLIYSMLFATTLMKIKDSTRSSDEKKNVYGAALTNLLTTALVPIVEYFVLSAYFWWFGL